MLHDPSTAQQAPGAHAPALQAVPAPWKTEVDAAQEAESVSVQLPSVMLQHAPAQALPAPQTRAGL
jgi:hypothetical protein